MNIAKASFQADVLNKVQKRNENLSKKTDIYSTNSKIIAMLNAPCDAKYLLNKKNNVSFGGKYNFKRISSEELEIMKKEVKSKADEMFIDLGYSWDRDARNTNITIQVINALLNHKIIENESLKDEISSIRTSLSLAIGKSTSEMGKNLLNFADFITSDEVKDVYNDETVQDNMGNIMSDVIHFDVLIPKKNMVKYINEHKELLNKGINLGKYIAKAWINTYEDLISQLQQPEPPVEPLEAKKNADDRPPINLGDLFAPKETEETKNLGTVKTKTPKELSGFERIGGQSKAIEQLKRAVIFPRRFPQLYKGRNMEKGAILYGPPGTGKSLMATAFAEEYGAYFVKIAATEMQNKYVGQTEQNWRNLFEDLKANQPALLFIDEIDALCKKRGSGDVHGDKELNQFLKLVSDIKAENLDVFILGATNDYEALDPAILRDGRFGLHIEMLPPQTLADVEEIFNIHSKDIKLDENVKSQKQAIFQAILDLGLTGAGIEALINKAYDNAFERLGLFEKMENNTVTEEDAENFSIKAEDFFAELEKQKSQKQAPKNRKIGFCL